MARAREKQATARDTSITSPSQTEHNEATSLPSPSAHDDQVPPSLHDVNHETHTESQADRSSQRGSPEYTGGPRPIMTINLSSHSGGPIMHLQRSLRFNQMQIRFEHGMPDERYLASLKYAGWSDRTESEGVWTKQIDRDARWQSVARMEQEFSSLANDIRKDRGLEPVWQARTPG